MNCLQALNPFHPPLKEAMHEDSSCRTICSILPFVSFLTYMHNLENAVKSHRDVRETKIARHIKNLCLGGILTIIATIALILFAKLPMFLGFSGLVNGYFQIGVAVYHKKKGDDILGVMRRR